MYIRRNDKYIIASFICTSFIVNPNQSARKERDRKDTLAILEYLCDRNPFSSDVSLRNIETGVVAEPDVNVDKVRNDERIKCVEFQF